MIGHVGVLMSVAIPAVSQVRKISRATPLAAIKESPGGLSTVRKWNANTTRRDSHGKTIVAGMKGSGMEIDFLNS